MKILFVLSLTFLVTIIWYMMPSTETLNQKDSLILFSVDRGRLEVILQKKGTVQPINPLKIVHGIRSKHLAITYLVPEGKIVEKGEILARFDGKELHKDFNSEMEKLEQKTNEYEIAKLELELLKEDNKLEVVKKVLQKAETESALNKYKKFEVILEERKKNIQEQEAKLQLSKTEKKLENLPDYIKEGLAAEAEFYTTKAEYQNRLWLVDKAHMEKNSFHQYDKVLEMLQKVNAATIARADLSANNKNSQVKVRRLENNIMRLDFELDRIKRNIGWIKKDIEKLTIVSPVKGIAMYGGERRSDNIKVGNSISSRSTIFTIPNMDKMYLQIEVDESEVYLLKEGMSCTIKKGSKHIPGVISNIADMPKITRRKEPGKFIVSINPEQKNILKPRSFVEVRVQVESIDNALFMPKHCFSKKLGKYYCYIDENGKPVEREIQIGIIGEKFVHIKSGVKEGEKVYLAIP